jgi:hypothetical protein
MKTLRSLAAPVALVAALLAPAAARADCWYPNYYVDGTPDALRVCTYGVRTCGPDEGLLRRNVDSGEIVKITTCDGACFLDQCVPAGSYEYGLEVPFACTGERCGTVYYWPLGTQGASPGCTRTVAAPETAASVPWDGTDGWVCRPVPWKPEAFGCNSSSAVLGLNGLVLAAGALLWRRRRRG